MFFDGWAPLIRTAVVGVLAYVALAYDSAGKGIDALADVKSAILETNGTLSIIPK